MLGYDWPRLHAALNDLPAALIVMGALLTLVNQFLQRDTLRAASYWMVVLGWLGAIAAVIAGLQAEDVVAHGGATHEAFERHELLGLITLGVITAVALWRIVRERKMGRGEQSALMGLTLAAAGLVVSTSQIGGDLVYDHALGIETPVLQEAITDRAAGHEHAGGAAHTHDESAPHDHPPGSAAAVVDSIRGDTLRADSALADSARGDSAAAGHTHAPGTPAHEH
jgi:uncharacterized membrane protein